MPTLETIKQAIESFQGNRLLVSYDKAKYYDSSILKGVVSGNCNNYCGALAKHLSENGVACAIVDNLPKHEYLVVISEYDHHKKLMVIDPTIAQFSLNIGEEHKPYFVGEFEEYKKLFKDNVVLSNKTKINFIHYSKYTSIQKTLYNKDLKELVEKENITYSPFTISQSIC